MPAAHTAHFGLVEYDDGAKIDFRSGLPAFESERSFLALRPPGYEPLLFLQSLATPQLSFLAIPIGSIALDYRLELNDEDLELLGGLAPDAEFEVLALVAVSSEGQVTANLQAPIVIHGGRRLGVQAVQAHAAYSCRHPLGQPEAANGDTAGLEPHSPLANGLPEDTPCS